MGPPGQRADPGYQLGERERLGQVVVGATAKPRDAIFDGARRGQQQDPGPDRAGELGAHLVAVNTGQVAVEHDHVVVVDQRSLQGGVPVQGGVDRHPLQAQPGRDRLGQLAVVLCHEYPHGGSPCCCARRVTCP